MFPRKESVDELHEKIDTLTNDIVSLHKKIDTLESLLRDDIKPSCNKMGGHIDFVEHVYENVQSPLGYIVGKVNYMLGGDTNSIKALPDLEACNNTNKNENQR
jgi:hypothetical protein